MDGWVVAYMWVCLLEEWIDGWMGGGLYVGLPPRGVDRWMDGWWLICGSASSSK